jgi:hypothetical protein
MITSLVSTFCGALFGGFQNYLEHKEDSTREIQIAKIQADKEIQIASQQTVISQNQSNTQASITEQEGFKTESSLKQSDTNEYKAFAEAVTQTSSLWNDSSGFARFANFITVTTRPIVTYILLILVFVVTMKIIKGGEVSENHLIVFDLILAEFSAVMSYWFVRRSFEKRQTPSFVALKKKLK